jgi:hypothetical protein
MPETMAHKQDVYMTEREQTEQGCTLRPSQ